MDLIFEPLVGLGLLKFGMTETEVNSIKEKLTGVGEFSYQDGKLCAFSLYPDEAERLFFAEEDILKMERLPAALYFANLSNDYGQAQGGSLYFMDLCCAILQFESNWREFIFFSSTYSTGEPLRKMTPESIEDYYEGQMQMCEEEDSLEDLQNNETHKASNQIIDNKPDDIGTKKPWWKFW